MSDADTSSPLHPAGETRVSRARPTPHPVPDAEGLLRITACPDVAQVGSSFALRTELRGGLHIGREFGVNGLAVNDPDVSRQHALIVPGAGGHVIHDLNSTNGTWVNGERVAQKALSSGDSIVIGATTLVYERRRASDG
jgi:hypothetical protein